jgi:hypothetical protein
MTKQAIWRDFALLGLAGMVLTACEGVGIVATDNPNTKVSQAVELLKECRVMQARRQLDEAIPLFEKANDQHGLAEAYRQYGFVARVGGANANPTVYCLRPVERVPPNPEGLDRSDAYFNRAADLASQSGDLHLLSNVKLLLGKNQVVRGNLPQACALFDGAIEVSREANIKQPGVALQLPPGVKTFEDGVNQLKAEVGCPPKEGT